MAMPRKEDRYVAGALSTTLTFVHGRSPRMLADTGVLAVVVQTREGPPADAGGPSILSDESRFRSANGP
jgi:hypothetical protein